MVAILFIVIKLYKCDIGIYILMNTEEKFILNI